MTDPVIEDILQRPPAHGTDILSLLKEFHSDDHARAWQGDPRLYQWFGRKLVKAGYFTRAFELVREGLDHHPQDQELKYLQAWSLARGGNISKAMELARGLLEEPGMGPDLLVEAHSLLGRLSKDRYCRAQDPAQKARFAEEAAALYEEASRISGSWYPGINAATMFLLAGREEKARELAAGVVEGAGAALRQPGGSDDYWLLATLGEANLILGRLDEATSFYSKAVEKAAGETGDIASMRRNLKLLRTKIAVGEGLLDLFNVGRVVVFSGHMIDYPVGHPLRRPDRPDRFPPDPELERAVLEALRRELETLNATVGYSSAACGSDLLFAEVMLERGAELHVVLPFDKGDFYQTSVDFDEEGMQPWRARFERVLEAATEVHYATKEHFLGDEVLFRYVNSVTQGLALLRADQLGVDPCAMVVIDPASQALVGGTAYFLDQWRKGGREAREINLASLRAAVTGERKTPAAPVSPRAGVRVGQERRQVQVMLFADVKNFSKLQEEQAPSFFVAFLNKVAEIIAASTHKPVFCNTWGDGLFLVFEDVVACADFAVRLLAQIEEMDWTEVGLPEDTTVRMGIHAGPVYRHEDPIIQRGNYFGSHVNRAARIEPVTTPGCAFTTEQFAAILALEGGRRFECDYVAIEELAKGYDRCALYRLAAA
jgi:class 3 adenylate cyclase/tetratricopeptide (TPR) repeat protein